MCGSFVNRLTVSRDKIYSEGTKTIHFLRYTGDQLTNRNMSKFIEVVYRNFEELSDIKSLGHSKKEIARLITSPNSIVIMGVTDSKSIISYLMAEATTYDLRILMHIYYIYTVPFYRGHGIATRMLNLIQDYSSEKNIKTLSLTYDTYNQNLTRFYFANNFEYDPEIRSYRRHDMLVKFI